MHERSNLFMIRGVMIECLRAREGARAVFRREPALPKAEPVIRSDGLLIVLSEGQADIEAFCRKVLRTSERRGRTNATFYIDHPEVDARAEAVAGDFLGVVLDLISQMEGISHVRLMFDESDTLRAYVSVLRALAETSR